MLLGISDLQCPKLTTDVNMIFFSDFFNTGEKVVSGRVSRRKCVPRSCPPTQRQGPMTGIRYTDKRDRSISNYSLVASIFHWEM